MKSDNEILESLIAGGLIGAALGALITNGKHTEIGAVAGAAIVASFRARQKAMKKNIPMLVEENNALYEISRDGSKTFIKSVSKNTRHIPKNFILK